MFVTPLFRERCNSILSFIGFRGSVPYEVFHEDELDVVRYLIANGKLKTHLDGWHNPHVDNVNATPFIVEYKEGAKQIHPMVLELAAENPECEAFVAQYRKNYA